MPAQVAGRRREHLGFRHTFRSDPLNQRIVRVHEREVHLRHEHVRVIPWIANDGRALAVAQHIPPA